MLSGFDTRNMRLRDAKFFRQDVLRLIAIADTLNVVSREASIPMLRGVVMAASFGCVGVVLGLGAYLKMGWFHAGRVIAGMAYNHAIWDRADKELVGVAVGADGGFARQQENAVSIAVLSSRPKPAIACFVDAAFEYIVRAKKAVIVQSAASMGGNVTRAAKLPRYGVPFMAIDAGKFYSLNPVCHGCLL